MDERILIKIYLKDGCCSFSIEDKNYEIEYKDNNENLLEEKLLKENIKIVLEPIYETELATELSNLIAFQLRVFFITHPINPSESCIYTSYQLKQDSHQNAKSKSKSKPKTKRISRKKTSDDEYFELKKFFWDEYIANIYVDFDDVYILSANSGEINAFIAYLAKNTFKKNGSKKPLIIASKEYHKDILEMYLPEYSFMYIDCYPFTFSLRNIGSSWEYNNHKFYIMYNRQHFDNVNCFFLNNYYYDAIVKYVGLSYEESQIPNWTIKQEVKDTLLKKIKPLKLDLENLIILAPEASTISELSSDFWNKLDKELNDLGFSTFINIARRPSLYVKDNDYPILTYKEIFYLTTLSKTVVSLRSGLTEFLIPSDIPIITLFSPCWGNKTEIVKNIYSVKGLPYVTEDKVQELYTDAYPDYDLLIEEILTKIKSIKDKKFSS